MKHTCPKCNSDQIQTFRMAFETGTSTDVSHTIGGGAAGGNLGGGVAATSGLRMSALAQQVMPPQKQTVGCGLWVASIFFFPIFFYAVYKTIQASKWNKEVYPKLYEEWENSWICLKCGNAFLL